MIARATRSFNTIFTGHQMDACNIILGWREGLLRSISYRPMTITWPIKSECDPQTYGTRELDSHVALCSVTSSYSVCIRQEKGFCCIQYMPCTDANSFTIDTLAMMMSETDSGCTLDYVGISGDQATMLIVPLTEWSFNRKKLGYYQYVSETEGQPYHSHTHN